MDSVAWRDVSEDDVAALAATVDVDDIKGRLLALLCKGGDGEAASHLWNEEQLAIAADLFFFQYAFAKGAAFSALKTSTCVPAAAAPQRLRRPRSRPSPPRYLSIIKDVFDADCTRNEPKESMEASFERCRAALFMHSVEQSPHSVGIFAKDDFAAILTQVMDSYFRHYRLYKFAFARKLQVTFTQKQPFDVEAPRVPRPLAQALPQAIDAEDAAAQSTAGSVADPGE